MQLITTENEAVDELDDEIDLTPPSPSNICSTFASEFKDVHTTGLKHWRRYGKKEVTDSIKTKLDLEVIVVFQKVEAS